jgi:hypothetical protein
MAMFTREVVVSLFRPFFFGASLSNNFGLALRMSLWWWNFGGAPWASRLAYSLATLFSMFLHVLG